MINTKISLLSSSLIILVFLNSCNTIIPEKPTAINYATSTTFFSAKPSFSIDLPGNYKFIYKSLSNYQRQILGNNYKKYLYYTTQTGVFKYKTLCTYTDSINNLNGFTAQTIRNLKNIKTISSISSINEKELTKNLSKSLPISLQTKQQLNIISYNQGDSSRKNLDNFIIEYHVLTPDKKGILRFIWIKDNRIKGDTAALQRESLMLESIVSISTIKFNINQTLDEDPFSYADKFYSADYGYNYLLPITMLLRDSVINLHQNRQRKSSYYQLLATRYSLAGNYAKAIYYDHKIGKPFYDEIDTGKLREYKPISAKKYILDSLSHANFLLFNERHHIAQSRAFVRDLLPDLYQKGYRYLALEDLVAAQDSAITARKYPDKTSGYYMNDPIYAELVREALGLGYELIAYEDTVNCKNSDPIFCMNSRDLNEAKNLLNSLKKLPKAKTIVLAGYDHINKQTEFNWKHMVQNLQELSGAECISVDQTTLINKYNLKDASPFYQYITNKYKINEPVVLKNNTTFWVDSALQQKVDAEILFPATKYASNSIPTWVFPVNAANYIIEPKCKKYTKNLFLQVFYKNEIDSNGTSNSIPYINYQLEGKPKYITIKIPMNIKYTYILTDPNTNEVLCFGNIEKTN